MTNECPHCTTPGEATITLHGTVQGDPSKCYLLIPGTEVNVSILDVNGKERDRFDCPVDEVEGIPRLNFPHDPQIQDGETVQVNSLWTLDTPHTPDTAH